MGKAFQENAYMLHITTKSDLVEAAHSMSVVEQYQQPLCRALNIIAKEAPDFGVDDALEMVVKAISISVDPDGLVSTILVCKTFPRLGLPTKQPAVFMF